MRSVAVLNHCHTPMGMRLLRTCILQPSNSTVVIPLKSSAHVLHLEVLSNIEERLDAVQGMQASNCVRNMQYANEQQNL